MNRFYRNGFALACLAIGSFSCAAQANPWNGSWKMDLSSVKFVGAKFAVMTSADGYSIKMGSDTPTKTVCNGRSNTAPSPAPAGTMYTCTMTSTGYTVESSKGGKKTRKTEVSLSGDGKTMTRKSEMFPVDGSPYTMTVKAKRLSGGPGLAGEWQQVDMQESQETGVLTIAVTGDKVAFKETDSPKVIECKLDGTQVKIDDMSTIAIQQAGPKTLKVTYRVAGKVRRVNTFVLSADGKTVTETDVTPEPSPSTTSMVFKKV